jgi:hypothetical protein
MVTSMTTWATLAFTTLGGGTVGSIITAYGSQFRQRRQARSDARQAIRKADRLAADPPRTPRPDFTAALDALDTAAMLAGLSRGLTELHREACERHWVLAIDHWMRTEAPRPIGTPPLEGSTDHQVTEVLECWRTAHRAASLLADATWHPWASAPYRWYQTRRLSRALGVAIPKHAELDRNGESSSPKRERDAIGAAKMVANNSGAAQ